MSKNTNELKTGAPGRFLGLEVSRLGSPMEAKMRRSSSLIFRKIKISFLMRARASVTVVQGGDLTPFYLWSPPLGGAAQSAFFLDPAEERGDDPVWADESSGRVRGMAVKMTPLPRLK